MSAAELVETAKSLGVSFRVNIKGQVFARVTRQLPPGLLKKLRKNKSAIAKHINHKASSHVWSVEVDRKALRVIDPQRQTKAEFMDFMRKQFGKDRVGVCVRLWPEEACDE